MFLRRVHYISGIIMSVFIFLHLLNHLGAIFGVAQHINLMEQFRLFYRHPFFETLLLVATIIQVISGLRLAFTFRKIITTKFEKIHIGSGLYLALFLLIHVSVILAGRKVLHLDTNVYFGVAGLNTFPHNLFFVPYYSLAILSFFGHVAAIHRKKMVAHVMGLTPGTQAKSILITGLVITFLILFGLTNQFRGVIIPKEYNILIGK